MSHATSTSRLSWGLTVAWNMAPPPPGPTILNPLALAVRFIEQSAIAHPARIAVFRIIRFLVIRIVIVCDLFITYEGLCQSIAGWIAFGLWASNCARWEEMGSSTIPKVPATTYRSLQVAIAWWRKYLEQSCSNLPEKPGVFPHIGRDVILLHVFICFSFVRCVTSCIVPKSEQKRAPNDFTKDLFVTCSLCHVFRSLQSESVWPGLRSWHDPWHRH